MAGQELSCKVPVSPPLYKYKLETLTTVLDIEKYKSAIDLVGVPSPSFRVNQVTTCLQLYQGSFCVWLEFEDHWSMKDIIGRAAEPGRASLMVVHSIYHWCNMVQHGATISGPHRARNPCKP